MPLEAPPEIMDELKAHCAELDRRAPSVRKLQRYRDNTSPLALAVQEKAKAQNGVYMLLSDLAQEPWAGAPVDASLERLDQIGYRWGTDEASKAAWEIHQRNYLDAEGLLTLDTALTCGRGFEIVWDENGDDLAEITVESPLNVVVSYVPGSRFRRAAALRRWQQDGRWYATLFTPKNLWKFAGPAKADGGDGPPEKWEPHEIDGEPWPLPNPLGVVPVVEHAINRRLRTEKASDTKFGTAAGEFEHALAIIDRIHYTTFCGLAGITWAGFQTLVSFGVPYQYKTDADGNTTNEIVPPFEYAAGAIIQFPQTKQEAALETIKPDDAKQFIEHTNAYLARFGAVTRTPVYKLSTTQIVNVGVEAMRFLDDSYIAKLHGYARWLGEAREETIRLAFAVEGRDDLAGFSSAEVVWRDPEITTLAAQADAAAKYLGAGLPWEIVAARVLKMSPTEIAESQELMAAGQLTAAATQPAPAPPAA